MPRSIISPARDFAVRHVLGSSFSFVVGVGDWQGGGRLRSVAYGLVRLAFGKKEAFIFQENMDG